MAIRRLDQSWQYDFTLEGHGRRRKAGFRTKAEAREAERRKREELISGQKRFLMANAYRMYVSATTMKPGSRDNCTRFWRDLESQIGHLYIEQVDTSVIDELKSGLPTRIYSHARPLRAVQRALGLREIGHHQVGRHSVASQAATGGHSIKAIQAQLGHKSAKSTHQYAHLGQRAQLRLVADLEPSTPPHVNLRSTRENR